jgi:hypothetical protein
VSPRWHAEYAEYVEGRLPWLRRIAYLLCQDWNVTLDGTRAELSSDGMFLCAANVHGLTVAVVVTVHGTIGNPAGPDAALGLARELHLLGPDPAAWTGRPLR